MTELYLLKVPLENDYKHTLYFANATEQAEYFISKKTHHFTDFSYQRKDFTIRCPVNYDDLVNSGCNYAMYRNTDYSNKWFYIFIVDFEYKNDENTIIKIETDCIQTWMFNYTIKPSFVEREHVSDDTVGMHLVDEGLEIGEYVCNEKLKTPYSDDLKIIVGVTERPDGTSANGYMYNGIYSGIKYYCFKNDSSGVTDVANFIESYASSSDTTTDAIVCMFLAPSKLIEGYIVNKNEIAQSSLTSKYYINQSSTQSDSNGLVVFENTNAIDGYVPTNNKLLTYPYRYMHVSNNNGADVIYRFEDWFTRKSITNGGDKIISSKPLFLIEGCLTPGCSIRLVPLNYKGVSRCDSEGLNMGKFPALNWTSDYFTNWLTQNAVNVGLSLVSGAVSTVGGIGLMATGAGALAGGSATIGGLTAIAGTLNEVKQATMIPNQAQGNINAGDVVTASYQNDFHFYDMCIRKEFAKIIDGYFTMFGYKVNTVKVPNTNHRKNFWFIKTIDVNIDGGIPNKDLQTIKNCYNTGITFWKNPSSIGNYTVSNTII